MRPGGPVQREDGVGRDALIEGVREVLAQVSGRLTDGREEGVEREAPVPQDAAIVGEWVGEGAGFDDEEAGGRDDDVIDLPTTGQNSVVQNACAGQVSVEEASDGSFGRRLAAPPGDLGVVARASSPSGVRCEQLFQPLRLAGG
jgi:hypothetical protein